jgi:tetratricopeptide (TPR) repeat protein
MSCAARALAGIAPLALCACAAPTADAAAAAEPGFHPLFPRDGAPAGWRVAEWSDLARPAAHGAAWTVADGTLRSPATRGTWLFSDAAYADFELRCEIRITERGNSGIALRAPAAGDPAFDGLEFQIADSRYNPGAQPAELSAGLYRALAPRVQAFRPAQWNDVRIRLQGSRVRALLNHVLVLDADLADFAEPVPRHDGAPAPPLRDRPRAGRIGFQHLSRDGLVLVRNARLRVLAPDEIEEEEWVWRGRAQGYAGDFAGAIATFGEGLAAYPESAALLRHRGHRHLSARRPDLAVRDLARAAELIRGIPDRIEADGQPNAAAVPRSTLHANVHYHLGLARWLRGDADGAAAAWRDGLAPSSVNDDMLCATSYWLHAALLRLGRTREARGVLAPIRADMEILENRAYHELLLAFRSERTADQILDGHPPGSVEHATRAYGVGLLHLAAGRRAEASAAWRSILAGGDPPAAFGFLAAEAELARADG